jgi:hypothetical protein
MSRQPTTPRGARALLPLLLSSGALQGPQRRSCKPTLTVRQRFERALRALLINRMGPKL